jgi:hypothetical protein
METAEVPTCAVGFGGVQHSSSEAGRVEEVAAVVEGVLSYGVQRYAPDSVENVNGPDDSRSFCILLHNFETLFCTMYLSSRTRARVNSGAKDRATRAVEGIVLSGEHAQW